ncbi:hypothetical protein NQ315_011271 [Exocentrus adspersus]|uniref:Uncharacterized protein n=1 Tax=Exocentrus adspersus TaxID=1586481 RepID=A0AAV8VAR1_9CUCU|nr:hypothetical protein NQ315_011271 [Exocentrus adspersus]
MYSECEDEVPQDILEEANVVSLNLLPLKSREKYEKEYKYEYRIALVCRKKAASKKNDFAEHVLKIGACWMETREIRKICEEVGLFYFCKKCANLKHSTLWCKYSMLRSTLQIKDNIDIKCPKLVAFLKRKSAGYKAKKANTFSRGDINKFIAEASDETYI